MSAENKKLLGFWDLMSISLGQIIGTGVVVLTGISISMTGYGAPWAFILALLIVAMPTICIAALGSAVPSTGGNYTYVRDMLGARTSFLYLSLLIAGQVILASFAIGFAEYAEALFPDINLTMTAAIIMVLCYLANLMGIKTAARFQSIMVLVLVGSLVFYILSGFAHIEDYSHYGDMSKVLPNGFGGFFAAAFLLRLSLIGSEFVSEFGGEMENPGKLIPLVMGLSLLLVVVLYICIAIVATGVLPLEQVIGENLAATAKVVFSPAVYYAFIGGGIMVSLVTSLNAIFAWCTRGLYMATEDGWLPSKLATKNRFGTPYIYLTLFFIVGITPILTGLSLEYVAILGNAVGAIFGLFPVFALYNLASRKPEAYANAPFKLPLWATKVFPLASVVIYGYGIYSSWDFIGNTGWLMLAGYAILICGYIYFRAPHVPACQK
ncbi:APC family permease [Pseudemcibacter aquimaris]|uniref:APC family permease n=1 Tax=Pseudemcibacter aquimaris TaxID=2857064 RepID=UPI002011D4F4|nr:APC family permease [Pseudemcibacter aquimaris]MCC3860597.1 APC family permease [Pseudemcibacter aquimaris]WDU59418.1 APC family permease [Pseudemcibacter aquimaris]